MLLRRNGVVRSAHTGSDTDSATPAQASGLALLQVWLRNGRDEAVPFAATSVDDARISDDSGDGQQRVVRVDHACCDACSNGRLSGQTAAVRSSMCTVR
jgi:hypothetical protein